MSGAAKKEPGRGSTANYSGIFEGRNNFGADMEGARNLINKRQTFLNEVSPKMYIVFSTRLFVCLEAVRCHDS